MSKSRMAVRNKNKGQKKQLKFDFSLPGKLKPVAGKAGLTFLFLAFTYFALDLMYTWPEILPVEKVSLKGDKVYVSEREITKFVQQQTERGMMSIDLKQLHEDAKNIDWVKNAEIRKVWPAELSFTIEEHKPVARFNNFVLTQQGTLIEHVEQHENQLANMEIIKLPKIEMANSQDISTKSATKVWLQFKQMKRKFELLSLSLISLNIDEANNWKLFFLEGVEFNLGRHLVLARANRLVNVYQEIERNSEIKKIDLRYHNGIAVEWYEENTTRTDKEELKLKG